MSGEKASVAEATKQAKEGQARTRSSIGFPYVDIGAAMELANAIHAHVGFGECDDDQLAAWTDQSPKSSGFREQLRVARMTDLIDASSGKNKLTELGRTIVDPNQTREAMVRAFLNVPLFSAVFEKYRGGVLPPAAALEGDIVGLGVSEKQKDRARQVFERSAEQAGFFEHGKNRLVKPGVQSRETSYPPPDYGGGNGGDGGDGKFPPGVDPIISGLLARLPKAGTVWPEPERNLWIELLKGSFKLIYKDGPSGKKEAV
jgi:hypothetical protein